MKITKTTLWLFLIVILAFALRLLAAKNMDISPDEIIYTITPLNIISAGRLSTVEQAPVFFYLTDIGYRLFGFSPITARLPAIIFGSASAILIYLLAADIFSNKKTGLLAAFLFALSGYTIINNVEMDITAFFFVLLSIYFFLRFLTKENYNLLLSSLALGIGLLCKPFVAIVLPIYLLVYLIHIFKHKKWEKSPVHKKDPKTSIYSLNISIIKTILASIAIILISFAPIFAYNYLLYKEKGITDYYFTTILGIGDDNNNNNNNKNIYAGLGGQNPWSGERVVGLAKVLFTQFLNVDGILLILGVLGIIYALGKRQAYRSDGIYLLVGYAALHFAYLGGRTGSSSHYVLLMMIASIFAGNMLLLLSEKIKQWSKKDIPLAILLIAIVIVQGAILYPTLSQKSSMMKLRDFSSTISDDALVIVDPLIYRGLYTWALSDKHYLEGTYFPELSEQLTALPGEKIQVPFYYIECGRNSKCGWKVEDYERIFDFSETLTDHFKKQLSLVATIKGSDVLTFPVYQGTISITPAVYDAIDQTHFFFFYPVGWHNPKNAVDSYTTDTSTEKMIHNIGKIILVADVAIAFLFLLGAFFLPLRRSD